MWHMLYMYNIYHMEDPLLATHVVILNEIVHPEHPTNDWHLCLQWGRYQYDYPASSRPSLYVIEEKRFC